MPHHLRHHKSRWRQIVGLNRQACFLNIAAPEGKSFLLNLSDKAAFARRK
jgi:hypothetical protein